MSKRNVTFLRPEEPSFLRKLKEQAGYKEGPTVDTKREALDLATQEDYEDGADEAPTVVVLKPGDLTAEEAAKVEEELHKKEEEERPADLSAPIAFRPRPKKTCEDSSGSSKSSKRSHTTEDKSKKSSKKPKKSVLSFDEGEEEEEDE